MNLSAASQAGPLTSNRHPLLLFFDGECAFCNRWVNRLRDADHAHRIRYGTKQGETFRTLVGQHPELAGVESVVLLANQPDGREKILVRSAAVRQLIEGLAPFRLFAMILRIVPTPLADLGYRLFSKIRTPLFGKLSQCRVPGEDEKALFVD